MPSPVHILPPRAVHRHSHCCTVRAAISRLHLVGQVRGELLADAMSGGEADELAAVIDKALAEASTKIGTSTLKTF